MKPCLSKASGLKSKGRKRRPVDDEDDDDDDDDPGENDRDRLVNGPALQPDENGPCEKVKMLLKEMLSLVKEKLTGFLSEIFSRTDQVKVRCRERTSER